MTKMKVNQRIKNNMKLGLCVLMAAVVAIFFAYLAGGRVGYEKCRVGQNVNVIAQQSQIIKIQEEINAKAYNRNTIDIRRRLREKYTIAE